MLESGFGRLSKLHDFQERVQAFRDHLVTLGLLDESIRSELADQETGTCHMCDATLIQCPICRTVTCPSSSESCPVSQVSPGPMVQCVYHPTARCCSSCLQRYDAASQDSISTSSSSSSATVTTPTASTPVRPAVGGPPSRQALSTCPECQSVCCAADLLWCVGRPGANGHRIPRPVACEMCYTQKPAVRERVKACMNEGCWSNDDRYCKAVMALCVCADCALAGPSPALGTANSNTQAGPCECECGRTWLCGTCSSDPYLWAGHFSQCPRCKKLTCLVYAVCGGAIPCDGCRRARLCDDCIEIQVDGEDEVQSDSRNVPARTMGVCEGCSVKMCDSCADHERDEGEGWVSKVGYCPDCQEAVDRPNTNSSINRMMIG